MIEAAEAGRLALPRPVLARAQSDLAQHCERRGEFREAFRLFEAANRTNCEGSLGWQAQADAYLAQVEELAAALQALPQLGVPSAPPPSGPQPTQEAPIFLIGFPRSGTTLMDQLLAGHSGLAVMEEKTLLDSLAARLGATPAARLAALAGRDAAARAVLRDDYWSMAEEEAARKPGRLLVDKLPLNILNLWLIDGLFPAPR